MNTFSSMTSLKGCSLSNVELKINKIVIADIITP
jgi:hypothetical protein